MYKNSFILFVKVIDNLCKVDVNFKELYFFYENLYFVLKLINCCGYDVCIVNFLY